MDNLPASQDGHRNVLETEPKPEPAWLATRVATALGASFRREEEAAQKMILADWFEDLQDHPQRAIEMAFTEWRRSSRFPPSNFEILSIVRRIVVQTEPDLRSQRLRYAKSWMEANTTIPDWMDVPQTVLDLFAEGYDAPQLRGAGFTVNDPTIEQRNVAQNMAEATSKTRAVVITDEDTAV